MSHHNINGNTVHDVFICRPSSAANKTYERATAEIRVGLSVGAIGMVRICAMLTDAME